MLEPLKDLDAIVIREKKEYAGVPPAWKLKPVFCLTDSCNRELFYALPEKGENLALEALKTARAFTLYLVDPKGAEALCCVKNFSLFSNKMEIFDGAENLLGLIHKKTSASKSHFQVMDAGGQLLYDIEGPADAPESFQIHKNGSVVGKISQRWAEAVEKEFFKVNHFGIIFPLGAEITEKAVLAGALILIDTLF